ncbi:hypothetical protein CAPTEDRAFT_193237 [Capitella teleta]|uniref:Nucleotide-diphospho-sugar transferase domain-containing protein n=1 Tax=Capitella teleta TaxID=283909 RepID=R7UGW8_CAPTE|nr:hypothetical protein CAPTEDRAFT_193237 [Capitella teleta]|eukprot:ELU05789.1 hypothetical protein CAPTEDRAFT_193237 [Capitella teleta]
MKPTNFFGVAFITLSFISVILYRQYNYYAPNYGNSFLRSIATSKIVGRKSYNFCYKDKCKTGKPFNLTQEFVRVMDQLRRTTVDDDVTQMVFVTAASANHFTESLDSIGSIQKHFPGSLILYYDWGLRPAQRRQIQAWCDVTLMLLDLREFANADRSQFYVWKVLVITHALLDHPCVFWIDASIRIMSSHVTGILEVTRGNGGFAMFGAVGKVHSTFAVTHHKMYEYLATDTRMQTLEGHFQSGAVFLLRSDFVVNEILQWWLLCAMHSECMTPITWSRCDFTKGRMTSYANCHRFDQSAINILASNAFGFIPLMYWAIGGGPIVKVQRGHTKQFNVSICSR